MHSFWRLHRQSDVRSHGIVSINGLFDLFAEIFEGFAAVQKELLFKNTVHALGQGILITIIAIGH